MAAAAESVPRPRLPRTLLLLAVVVIHWIEAKRPNKRMEGGEQGIRAGEGGRSGSKSDAQLPAFMSEFPSLPFPHFRATENIFASEFPSLPFYIRTYVGYRGARAGS